jgi:hypothetical protein
MPDEDIDRLVFNIAQVPAEQVAYIEDQPMFVRVAVRVIHMDEEWMIANTVCRVLSLGRKEES